MQFLEMQTDHIATAIDSVHCEVVLPREYRTRLIADALTLDEDGPARRYFPAHLLDEAKVDERKEDGMDEILGEVNA